MVCDAVCCLLAIFFFLHACINMKDHHLILTFFLGLSTMNEVMGVTPCSIEGDLHYARVSKVSADSFESSSTSSGEYYENATRHDLIAPGLSSYFDLMHIYFYYSIKNPGYLTS